MYTCIDTLSQFSLKETEHFLLFSGLLS